MTFQFDKDKAIWIYGCGAQGKTIFTNLVNHGYCVNGFVDRKADSRSVGATVIAPDCISDSIKTEEVVVISFQNIHEHQKVAHQLSDLGIHNIVYLKKDTSFYPKTIDLYNSLLYGGIPTTFVFPKTYNSDENTFEELYFRDNDDTVVIDVPVQLVFSDALEAPLGSYNLEKYNYNITAAFEYTSLFNLFLYGKTDHDYLSRYIERIYRMSTDKRSREDFLADRIKLCEEMYIDFQEKGLEPFRCAASFSEYDKDRGRFILKDGHHRAGFLACLNQNRIPIRISKDDYLLWSNNNSDLDIIEHSLFTPILHPGYYYSFKAATEMNGALLATALYECFSRIDVRSFSVLDLFSTCGYYSRIFWRMGAKEVVSADPRESNRHLISILNSIENNDAISVVNESSSRAYDIIVSCNDVAWDFDLLKEKSFSQYFSLCNKYCVISLKRFSVEIEDYFIGDDKFSKYSKIHTYTYLGKQMEVYVFEK